MKKITRTMVLTLSILVTLNAGAKITSAKNINNQPQNTVGIENQIGSTNNNIDPDCEGK